MKDNAGTDCQDPMSAFDDDIRLEPAGEHAWTGLVTPRWNIGANPNGGYLLALAYAGMRQAMPAYPDPLSVTVHYLKPGLPDRPCRVDVEVLSTGRRIGTARATLFQDGTVRLAVLASLGDLATDDAPALTLEAPAMPLPEACLPRSPGEQGLAMPILDHVETRLHPDQVRAGGAGRAQVSGWVRFRDGREPDTLSAMLFADVFPPAVFGLVSAVGWVPTVALTVQVRRRPAPGWMLARFDTVDMLGDRLIEDGLLWDAQGRLVVQSRQLALLRTPGGSR
jgi:acyl-CoA thioesterase